MPLLQWDKDLSVGVAACDGEHQKLIEILNDLWDAMKGGKGQVAMRATLDRLISYTRTHFANEERMMATHNYPELAKHKAEHDKLTKQVLDVQKRFNAGAPESIALEMVGFLKSWLQNHIQGVDKRYTLFMHTNGVR